MTGAPSQTHEPSIMVQDGLRPPHGSRQRYALPHGSRRAVGAPHHEGVAHDSHPEERHRRASKDGQLTGVRVVIPVWNEEEAIAGVIARIPRDSMDEIIVADGGSTDRTVEIAEANGARVIDAGKGYGRACLEGARAAGDACKIVVYMDGDGSDYPEKLPELIASIVAGTHDFVIASRARGEREPGSMAWHQLASGRIIGGIVGLLYGFRYTDMCAFRAVRRDSLLALDMQEMTYGWNLEMQMKAARSKLRILEIPVPYARRAGGSSKVAGSFRGTLRAGSRILITLARVALQKSPATRTPKVA